MISSMIRVPKRGRTRSIICIALLALVFSAIAQRGGEWMRWWDQHVRGTGQKQ